MNRVYLLLALIGLIGAGCQKTRPSSSEVTLGKSTPEELRQEKGEPAKIENSPVRRQAQIYYYDHNEKYQVENGKVVARFSDPASNETQLQYWRHLWSGQNPSYIPLEDTRDPHGKMKYLLRADKLKKAVVYDPELDRVIRVVEYEK